MKKIFIIACVLCIALASYAQQTSQSFRLNNYNLIKGKIAIQGYDPVAYFTRHKATKGNPDYRLSYAGIIYQFESKEHLEIFRQNPAHYEPQYGGWCAYAMGQSGEKVEIDPETFKIVDEKLYLFYNKYFNNTLIDWNKDQSMLMIRANKNWQKFQSK